VRRRKRCSCPARCTRICSTIEQPPRLYRVRVTWLVTECDADEVVVAASSDTEAARLAVERVEENAAPEQHDHDAEDVEALDEEPSGEQLQAWIARQGVTQ